jgi:ATP-dependent Lon protease
MDLLFIHAYRIGLTDPIPEQDSLTVKVTNLSEADYDKHSQEMKVCFFFMSISFNLKALSSEIVKTIRDIVTLNPLYRATIQQIMEMGIRYVPSVCCVSSFNSILENPAHLCDFGASLSTAPGAEIQAVLEELDVQKRLRLTLGMHWNITSIAYLPELLKKEHLQSKLQAKIRQDVEDKVGSCWYAPGRCHRSIPPVAHTCCTSSLTPSKKSLV